MTEWLKDQQRLRQQEVDAQSKRSRQKAEAAEAQRLMDVAQRQMDKAQRRSAR